MTYQKILIIQTAFIGDAILATGILEKWHQHFPECKVDFLVRKGNESLFKGHPFINELLIWNKQEHKYKNLWKTLQKIRQNRYGVVVNLQRFASTGFLTVFSKAKYTIGFDKNPWAFAFSKKIKHSFKEGTHEIERNQALISHLTNNNAQKPRLYPSQSDVNAIQGYQHKPYICIAPTSVWFTKQFPAEKWIELIEALPLSFTVYLLGAPSDQTACDEIIDKAKRDNIVNLAGKLTLLQSAALIAQAQMNYVNDSAPMHLASAMNAPTCAVYCSTIPSFGFYPVADHAHIVETKTDLDCRPCGIHGHKTCPKGHFKCAFDIQKEQLLDILT